MGPVEIHKDCGCTARVLRSCRGDASHLIQHLVTNGFAVAAFDLQGHGLSSGERAAIDDFSKYGAALEAFLTVIDNKFPGPRDFIWYSAGCAVILDRLLTGDRMGFDAVVMVAPLVQSAM